MTDLLSQAREAEKRLAEEAQLVTRRSFTQSKSFFSPPTPPIASTRGSTSTRPESSTSSVKRTTQPVGILVVLLMLHEIETWFVTHVEAKGTSRKIVLIRKSWLLMLMRSMRQEMMLIL